MTVAGFIKIKYKDGKISYLKKDQIVAVREFPDCVVFELTSGIDHTYYIDYVSISQLQTALGDMGISSEVLTEEKQS